VKIIGSDYSTKTYEGNGKTIVFIETSEAHDENVYNIILAFENAAHKSALDHILETLRF
jgi:hypothetical protein